MEEQAIKDAMPETISQLKDILSGATDKEGNVGYTFSYIFSIQTIALFRKLTVLLLNSYPLIQILYKA